MQPVVLSLAIAAGAAMLFLHRHLERVVSTLDEPIRSAFEDALRRISLAGTLVVGVAVVAFVGLGRGQGALAVAVPLLCLNAAGIGAARLAAAARAGVPSHVPIRRVIGGYALSSIAMFSLAYAYLRM